MDENGGFVHRKCNAYNGGKVSEIDQIERIELFEVIEFDGTFQLAAPSQDVFFDWQVWDLFLLLVGGILTFIIIGYKWSGRFHFSKHPQDMMDPSIMSGKYCFFFTVPFRRNKHGMLKPSQNCRNPESWYSGALEYIEH